MRHLLTLGAITEADVQKIGIRATDLSTAHKSKYSVPLSFIVPNALFYEFLLQNKLALDIKKTINSFENPVNFTDEIYSKIKFLFEMATIPEEFKEELFEAYEALSPIETHNAQALLESDEPVINLIISPSYIWESDKLSGILFNIQGFDNFLNGLKSCWLSLYSPEHLKLRLAKGIEEFTTGIIVQSFVQPECTIDSYSKSLIGDYDIPINAYFGLPDITYNINKDHYSVSKENFGIQTQEVKPQEHILLRNIKSGTLLKRSLGNRGATQKIKDKQIFELAKQIDRLSIILKLHFRIILFTEPTKNTLFLIDRICERASSEDKPEDSGTTANLSDNLNELNKNESKESQVLIQKETLAEILLSPITKEEPESLEQSKKTAKPENDMQTTDSNQSDKAFAWETTINSKENPETKITELPKAIILTDLSLKEDADSTEPERPAELSKEIIILDENDDFILSTKEETPKKENLPSINLEEKLDTKNPEPAEPIAMQTVTVPPSTPDNEFFMNIILDIEPALDQEIMKRYQLKFDKVPADVSAALEELSATGEFPENEQIFKLKSMKTIIERGETINLDTFLAITEELRKLI